jgi:tetratricopeptide (TPR) repeat protein
MPFRKKKTGSKDKNLPSEIDFDALWEKAYFPALSKRYDPVRADQDLGALIIKEMIERLVIADLVLADVTIPNANVYYELGIRHAAKQFRCVMIAAENSSQLFDITQMPQLRYQLKEGAIKPATAKGVKKEIERLLNKFEKGESPVWQSVPGYPDDIDVRSATSFKKFARGLFQFDTRIREAQLVRGKKKKKACIENVVQDYKSLSESNLGVAMKLLYLIRDNLDWEDVIEFINSMNEEFKNMPKTREQLYLAKSKSGEHFGAIAALEMLLEEYGETSETHGLLGGRYRKLYQVAKTKAEKKKYLDLAIEHYQKGMEADLNDYYPSSNLARLYRTRKARGDSELAKRALEVTKLACRRAMRVDPDDVWGRPTLIGVAFDEGDIPAAKRLLEEIKREGPAKWRIDTTVETAEMSIALHKDERKRRALKRILGALKRM